MQSFRYSGKKEVKFQDWVLKKLGLAGGAGRKLNTITTFVSWASGLWKVPLPRERERRAKRTRFEGEEKVSRFQQVKSELPGELTGRSTQI